MQKRTSADFLGGGWDITQKSYQSRRGEHKRGLGGIEPPTSPTLKENHTTRPKARAKPACWGVRKLQMRQDLRQKENEGPLLEVGFEPTHLAILELESSALDHSAIQARALRVLHGDVQCGTQKIK